MKNIFPKIYNEKTINYENSTLKNLKINVGNKINKQLSKDESCLFFCDEFNEFTFKFKQMSIKNGKMLKNIVYYAIIILY